MYQTHEHGSFHITPLIFSGENLIIYEKKVLDIYHANELFYNTWGVDSFYTRVVKIATKI